MLQALIREEWPGLDGARLEACEGRLDAVVVLVADHTERTRALTRRQLAELLAVALEPAPEPLPRPGPRVAPRPSARAADREPLPPALEPFDRLLRSLEGHVDELTQQVKADVAPLAMDTARQHIGLALLLAGGLGLMLGLFLGALGYPQNGKGFEGTDDDA